MVVALTSANADCSIPLGDEAATHPTGMNYVDTTLRRNDKITSSGAATNSATVCGQNVEVDPALLFMRVMYVLKKCSKMEGHLQYEFSKEPTMVLLQWCYTKEHQKCSCKLPVTLVA